MNCPSCGFGAGDGAAECPACGVIFAKWKARPEAPPQAEPARSLRGGAIAAVLLLALAAVWLYARKTIAFRDSPAAAASPKAARLYLGPSAKIHGERPIALNPVIKLDGYTRRQIYDLRKREVARHPELMDADYEPNGDVLGAIEDGKPWWGFEGIYFHGDGMQSIAGLSEESRFIANPFLLVGIRETIARVGASPDGSANYYPYPTRLSWNSADASARAAYNVSGHFDFTSDHDFPAEKSRELQFVLYNARDLGFLFFSLDHARSSGIRLRVDSGEPVKMIQFIHCGGSCGYPGGCSNMSPFSPNFFFEVPSLPAKAVLKLWKQEPEDIAAPADMTFTIDMS